FAPKRTPAEIVAKLNQEVRKALEVPELRTRFAELGGEIKPMSPDELGAYVKSEHEKRGRVVKASGAKVDWASARRLMGRLQIDRHRAI
ncbi:MAG TPA: tripartite tricarboxylate transporter substrate-binding protein, partial [Microvirga sp.]|nr:tripartite tricarboxylate transporter substrate-binding protein [Microvirga sp.]